MERETNNGERAAAADEGKWKKGADAPWDIYSATATGATTTTGLSSAFHDQQPPTRDSTLETPAATGFTVGG